MKKQNNSYMFIAALAIVLVIALLVLWPAQFFASQDFWFPLSISFLKVQPRFIKNARSRSGVCVLTKRRFGELC